MALIGQDIYVQTTCTVANGLWASSIISHATIGAQLPFDLIFNGTLHWWEYISVGHATQYYVWMADKNDRVGGTSESICNT